MGRNQTSNQLRYLADMLESTDAIHLKSSTIGRTPGYIAIDLSFVAFPGREGFEESDMFEPKAIDTGRKIQAVKGWIRMGRNIILENPAQDFYISYNEHPGSGFSPFAGDGGNCETAIVRDGSFYVLNGDHRVEYEERIDRGFDSCIEFFLANEPLQSSWSDTWDVKG